VILFFKRKYMNFWILRARCRELDDGRCKLSLSVFESNPFHLAMSE
jgi:hypothetical protein